MKIVFCKFLVLVLRRTNTLIVIRRVFGKSCLFLSGDVNLKFVCNERNFHNNIIVEIREIFRYDYKNRLNYS